MKDKKVTKAGFGSFVFLRVLRGFTRVDTNLKCHSISPVPEPRLLRTVPLACSTRLGDSKLYGSFFSVFFSLLPLTFIPRCS